MADANTLIDSVLRPDRSASKFIFGWQNDTVENEWDVQDLPRRTAMARFTQPVKQELRDANDIHLDRLRTGYFDRIYEAGAKSVDPTFLMTPTDRRLVQSLSVEHYTKMRNARAFASRDSERFISHVWEDTRSRRRLFARRTQALGHFGIKGRLGTLDAVEDPAGIARMDKRFGVKAAVGADGRRWSLEKYSKLQGDAFGRSLYNQGLLNAAERKGVVAFNVSDGEGCGWSFHEDTLKADGMVVTIAEARANPLAHPFCQRRFTPTNNKKDLEKLRKRESSSKKIAKVLGVAAGAGLTAYAASAVSNIIAQQVSRLAASELFEQWIDHLRLLTWQGDTTAAHFHSVARRFQETFNPIDIETLESRLRGENVISITDTVWPGGPTWQEVPVIWRNVRVAGEEFVRFGRDPAPDVARFLNSAWPGRRTTEQIQLTYEYMVGAMRNNENRQNVINVINAEFQRRNLLQNLISRLPGGDVLASRINFTWTGWGKRLRLDPFDWLRGHVTFTPSGMIRSLSFFPKRAFTGVVKMYQDGSIGGHVSAIPSNFLNGIFRAIVEIDEHGALVGNLRIVPKGPLRVVLEFTTRTPTEVADNIAEQAVNALKVFRGGTVGHMGPEDVADFLVQFMKNHASPLGFRVNEFARLMAGKLVDAEIMVPGEVKQLTAAIIERGASLTFDPRDIVQAARQFGAARVARDLGYMVRQFKFNRAVVEWRIFNQSIFDISANLRIPLDNVRAIVRDLLAKKLIEQHAATGAFAPATYSGLFQWVLKNPKELFDSVKFTSRALSEIGQVPIRSTLFGNIRFSGLRAVEGNPFLQALKTGSVRFLSKAHFDAEGLREIATNMRIFGWNIYDIANVLKVRLEDINQVIDEGLAQVRMMTYRLGITKLDDAIPFWDEKVEIVRGWMSDRTTGDPAQRVDALQRVVKAMKVTDVNPVEDRALRYLAGINPGDTVTQVEVKLLHLRNWIRTAEAREDIIWRHIRNAGGPINPFTGFPVDVDAAVLRLYAQLGQFTKDISADDIIAKAQDLWVKSLTQPLNLTAENMRQALHTLDKKIQGWQYDYVKFKATLLENQFGVDTIRVLWDKWRILRETQAGDFIPRAFRRADVPEETLQAALNWRAEAQAVSSRTFEVNKVRFTFTDEAWQQFEFIRPGVPDLDDKFVQWTVTRMDYLRRRFPNVDLPDIMVDSGRAGGTRISYYENGVIHFDVGWAKSFGAAAKDHFNLDLADRLSTSVFKRTQYLRPSVDTEYTRLLFHEYGHYLVDHLTDEQVDDLIRQVNKRYGTKVRMIRDIPVPDNFNIQGDGFEIVRNVPGAISQRLVAIRSTMDPWSGITGMRSGSLRVLSREVGDYATMNVDELVAESMSHYLTYNDPRRTQRWIGEFLDERILGKDFANIVLQNRPRASERNFFESDLVESVFHMEMPTTARDTFFRKAVDIAQNLDVSLDDETIRRQILHDVFPEFSGIWNGDPEFDEVIQTYWQEAQTNVRKVRAAWLEMHGVESNVRYGEKDVVTAIHLDRLWDVQSKEWETPLFRGINYDTEDHEVMAHIKDLMTPGTEFELPVSSFSPNDELADIFAGSEIRGKPDNFRALMIELEEGSRVLNIDPLSDIEVLSHGRFEVVALERGWQPDDHFLQGVVDVERGFGNIITEDMTDEEGIELMRQFYTDRVDKVYIRRIGD